MRLLQNVGLIVTGIELVDLERRPVFTHKIPLAMINLIWKVYVPLLIGATGQKQCTRESQAVLY
jgi:hypothetical protein